MMYSKAHSVPSKTLNVGLSSEYVSNVYYNTTVHAFTLGIEETQSNVFAKHESTIKPIF